MNKRLLKEIKKGNTHYFYTNWIWRKKRQQIITRDNNECQKCKSKGRVRVGTRDNPLDVHHIKHLKDNPELGLTDSNLISLCGSCHNEEHPEKLGNNNESKKTIDIPERWE